MRAALTAVLNVLLVPAVAVAGVQLFNPKLVTDPDPWTRERGVIVIAFKPAGNCLVLHRLKERPASYTLPLCR